ncbi:MBOAT family O-acyltransferase [Sulfurospirillum barnesii]|uniref:Putative membrane protein involved in D-alanine export n=1 Tax=Sulfurospirillum barnesii (strain ATCC 700032 / DSM 10660 / SES-3) TaxID=760154 RepID=I3XZ04_SULBS|nr:MBOAT family protein [Sulfurospirillum barnesii]AFL69178.1 putative membrane protein involved in D-alanine export [Sulfurospirillum barnesii SES-3]
MLFNSYEFVFVFLPVVFFGYFFLTSKRLVIVSKVWLVLGSLFFYAWWNIAYLPLILFSMLMNFGIGSSLGNNKVRLKISKKTILMFGVILNLTLLGYFKYSDFFIANFNLLSEKDVSLLHVALPLAISFFTFQQIAYLVDSYRNETKEYDLLNYALFVTFFPQLIAGPIVHHKEMMPQFFRTHNYVKNYKNIAIGIFIFSIGLFKKVVIADTFAIWATKGFDVAQSLNLIEAWATSLSYTFQLYFDFSGYTDMAIGAALLFNITLPINFNSPYKALDIQDFWRRWHITLSRFLRDYIYIPLGGNRVGRGRNYINLFSVFLIGGLWHGASWMFVVWGALHGIAIVIHRMWVECGFRLNRFLAWFITFNFINITWVFFRAKELEDALKILKGMFGFSDIILADTFSKKLSFLRHYGVVFDEVYQHIGDGNKSFIWIAFAFIIIIFSKNSMEKIEEFSLNYNTALQASFYFLVGILSLGKISEFLYFNF